MVYYIIILEYILYMKKVLIAVCAVALLLGPAASYAEKKAPMKSSAKKTVKTYVNKKFGFQINFSSVWKGYSVQVDSDGWIYVSVPGVGVAKGNPVEAFSLYAVKKVKGKTFDELVKDEGPVGIMIGSNKKYYIAFQRTQDAAGLPQGVIDEIIDGKLQKSIKIK